MDEKQLELIIKKLDLLARLLAINIIEDKPVNEQIATLTKSGLKASEIAILLDKTENQVYVTQTKLRKSKKKELPEQKIFQIKEQNNV